MREYRVRAMRVMDTCDECPGKDTEEHFCIMEDKPIPMRFYPNYKIKIPDWCRLPKVKANAGTGISVTLSAFKPK